MLNSKFIKSLVQDKPEILIHEGKIEFKTLSKLGITDGELLKGIRYTNAGMRSQSIVMRSKSRTIRVIDTEHPLERMN